MDLGLFISANPKIHSFQKGIMETETKVKPVQIHRIYSEFGGSKVCGNFSLETPKKLGISETVIVSQCGQHRAKFVPTDNLAQKDTAIKITHGEFRGLSGNLDETAKKVSSDPKKSGWNFWRVIECPEWYVEKMKKLSTKVEKEMKLDTKLEEVQES